MAKEEFLFFSITFRKTITWPVIKMQESTRVKKLSALFNVIRIPRLDFPFRKHFSKSRDNGKREASGSDEADETRFTLDETSAALGAVYVVAKTAFLSRDENTRVSEVAEESRRIQASKRQ